MIYFSAEIFLFLKNIFIKQQKKKIDFNFLTFDDIILEVIK